MGRRKVILADFTQAKRDERGLDIEAPNGQVFQVDGPMFWPENFQELSNSGNNRTLGTAILGGEERMAEFEAAGGTPNMLMAIIGEVMLGGQNTGE